MTKTAACTDGVDNDDVDTVLVHILLTGASGYLGQHLLAHWITHGLELGVRSKGSTTTATTTTTTATTHYQTKITALYHRSEGFPGAVREFCANQRSGGGCGCGGISDVTVRSIDLTDPNDIAELLGGDVNMNANANANVNSGKKNAAAVNIVVHAAALSSPRLCQEDPDRARAINVPVAFFDAFLGLAKAANADSDSGRGISVSVGALLPSRPRAAIVALSTDQVYDGKQEVGALYRETETERGGLNPANVYGQTKLELEQYLLQSIRSSTSNACLCFALRSSIILGPEAPIAPDCAHGTFLDFCRSRGEGKQPTTFYTNEYRSVVRVDRVVDTIDGIIARKVLGMGTEEGSNDDDNDDDDDDEDYSRRTVIYNMGGPCRVHRMDMARAVFDRFGYDPELLLATEQKSPQSPLDISMDSSLLFRDGILDSNDNCNDTREEPGTYLKELVDYVFGAAEE